MVCQIQILISKGANPLQIEKVHFKLCQRFFRQSQRTGSFEQNKENYEKRGIFYRFKGNGWEKFC